MSPWAELGRDALLFGLWLLVAVSSCTAQSAHAGEWEALCCSYHWDQDAELNESNPGVIYRAELGGRWDLLAGVFVNSHRKVSTAGLVEWRWGPFGLAGGVSTGYSDAVMPAGLAAAHVGPVNLYAAPTDGGAVALSVNAIRW